MVLEAFGHSVHRLRWVKVRRWLRSSAALPTKHPPAPSGGGEGDFRKNVPVCREISVLVLCGSSTVLRTPVESSLTLSPRNR